MLGFGIISIRLKPTFGALTEVYLSTEPPANLIGVLALLTVPEGSIAYLAHPEHAYTGIGPGSYTLRRQREQADELRMVAD